jgi:hypothetical protein
MLRLQSLSLAIHDEVRTTLLRNATRTPRHPTTPGPRGHPAARHDSALAGQRLDIIVAAAGAVESMFQ